MKSELVHYDLSTTRLVRAGRRHGKNSKVKPGGCARVIVITDGSLLVSVYRTSVADSGELGHRA